MSPSFGHGITLSTSEYTDTLTFIDQSALDAQVAVDASWKTLTKFVVNGLLIEQGPANSLYYVKRYVGESNVPGDIRRLRASVQELMRRMGQPVIVKHMFNDHDAGLGIAQKSPVTDPTYGQTRSWDPYSYGTGYRSVQQSTFEWVNPDTGKIVTSPTSPGSDFSPAPMYRGYGPGYLTYLIEPDVPLDLFKLSPAGALTKVQSQTVVAGWFPEINDNDLIINVELDGDGNVISAHERYQAKQTRPLSIRGRDRRGRREYSADHGNRFVVNQNFEMSAIPETSPLMQVEIDR